MIQILLVVVLLACPLGIGLMMWMTSRGEPWSAGEEAAERAVRARGAEPLTVQSQLHRLSREA